MFLPGILNPSSENLLPQDGKLIYLPGFFASEEAAQLCKILKDTINWKHDRIKIFGKEVDLPRLTAWYGDPGRVYTYSGLTNHPEGWTPELKTIKTKIENYTERSFNSLLLNFYRSGDDHVSWHADDEQELGPNPFIASLSLGGVRRFQLKHKHEKDLPTITLELEPGSLVLMSEEIQHYWVHRLAPTKRPADPRLNLTFRNIR